MKGRAMQIRTHMLLPATPGFAAAAPIVGHAGWDQYLAHAERNQPQLAATPH